MWVRLGRLDGGVMVGVGCGVGHVAHAGGYPFPFFFLLFLCFWWCIVEWRVFRCFGMWGNVLFALVSALCTLVQILVFRGRKSTSRGCFLVSV